MEIALVILQNAVYVVYLVIVIYILWTDNKLRKALEYRDQQLVHAYDAAQFHFNRWERNWSELKKLKEEYDELKREYESSRPSVSVIAMEVEKNEKYEKLKSEYEELKREYALQKAENVTLAYINEKIGGIAKAKCPEIAAFLERMKLMREQAIKDMTERAKDLNEDDAWGNTFEEAAQKCSSEEWEEGAKKAEEQKRENESITH